MKSRSSFGVAATNKTGFTALEMCRYEVLYSPSCYLCGTTRTTPADVLSSLGLSRRETLFRSSILQAFVQQSRMQGQQKEIRSVKMVMILLEGIVVITKDYSALISTQLLHIEFTRLSARAGIS